MGRDIFTNEKISHWNGISVKEREDKHACTCNTKNLELKNKKWKETIYIMKEPNYCPGC